MLNWNNLFCSDRLPKRVAREKTSTNNFSSNEHRTPFERDYDRILFSTPVRRMADKTQVFPLEKNDSVRTRLTHSHEVSNLARSIGVALVHNTDVFKDIPSAKRDVPVILAATGLAHDLGNPPFGHQGEKAIGSWFSDLFDTWEEEGKKHGLTDRMKREFVEFEGNAQTLRVVTKLQLLNDGRGLNLTLGTLAALMKYPVPADKVDKSKQGSKKFNFFSSEDDVVNQIWSATGLALGIRHPLTFIMEACDDIAYSVLDTEDAVKKGLVSVSDVLSWLSLQVKKDEKDGGSGRQLTENVFKAAEADFNNYRSEKLSPSEFNDVSMQKLRVHAIAAMVNEVVQRFQQVVPEMLEGNYHKELIDDSAAGHLRDALKDFGFEHAYKHRSVLEIELKGYHVIRDLMNYFWNAIEATREGRATPFHRYVYGRISENYRRVSDDDLDELPQVYRDLQLLTDMIAGMTDGFAISLRDEFRRLNESATSQ
ncbi:dGTP triphosphohydrolase [Magnetovibrio sp.]|uniref:deoxyguanosinetriphosphate triphosphohydrolase family protein n=1 Tax=Magnetovibrio sp. TaxID=2024836 RepID=UPI002F955E56